MIDVIDVPRWCLWCGEDLPAHAEGKPGPVPRFCSRACSKAYLRDAREEAHET